MEPQLGSCRPASHAHMLCLREVRAALSHLPALSKIHLLPHKHKVCLHLCPALMSASACSPVPSEVGEVEGYNEGREAAGLLAGEGSMGGLRGDLRPSSAGVGTLAHLLPHLQEPHPAQTHHEPRSVRKMVGILLMCCTCMGL